MQAKRMLLIAALVVGLGACGGKGTLSSSGSSSGGNVTGSAANVATTVVNAGPSGDVNTLFTSVTICAPGSTSNCQTIDNIEIDTGSSGLRILASALTANLPIQTDSNGDSIAECTQFVSSYSWGPVALADVTIASETAASLPVQVIGDANFSTVPAACASTGTEEDTVQAFGANGILGIATEAQDCGAACATSSTSGFYYGCSSATNCLEIALGTASQLQNPVTYFATDNNGVIIELPSVAATGAESLTGALVFGIDTESNNASSGTATILPVQVGTGYLTVSLNGTFYDQSFLDTGSNGYYFTDASLTECTDTNAMGFYCPTSTTNFSAIVCGYDGSDSCTGAAHESISFSIGNADTLFSGNAAYTVFPSLGGGFPTGTTVDLGLPFFFGRNVYEAFENKSTSKGSGPYYAF
jgi:hypothetical protein